MKYKGIYYEADAGKAFRNKTTMEVVGTRVELRYGDIINNYEEVSVPAWIELENEFSISVVGDTVTIMAKVYDSDGREIECPLEFSSDNAAIATVSTTGIVTCLAPGTARITVRARDVRVIFFLFVAASAGDIPTGIYCPEYVTIKKGESLQLTASVIGGSSQEVFFDNPVPDIVDVSMDGLAVAKKECRQIIKVHSSSFPAVLNRILVIVEEQPVPITSIYFDKRTQTAKVGDEFELTALFMPEGAYAELNWYTNNDKVQLTKITDIKYKVTALSAGTSQVFAKGIGTVFAALCDVTITD